MMMKEMTKSLPVSKRMVYNSYLKVCDKNGGAGIDKQSIEMFDKNLSGNLGKRFMAYNIVERLQKLNHHEILLQIEGMVNNTQIAINKHHEVFEASFDWKECR